MTPREFIDDFPEELITADGFDDAIIGIANGWFPAEKDGVSQNMVVAYDYDKCVEILASQGMSLEDAEEHLIFNTLGAYIGPGTPVFVKRPPEGKDWYEKDLA